MERQLIKRMISLVIPVYNEKEVIDKLCQRLLLVLPKIGLPYEIVFVDDGSNDGSSACLDRVQRRLPQHISVVHLNSNCGQHLAIMAGFEYVRGEYIITMDADLQNPPEEIPKFVDKLQQNYDVVGGYRLDRQDKFWRKTVSRWHNQIREKIAPQLNMRDEGCMLRAYHRDIVDIMVATEEASTFIPALALTYARRPVEIGVKHAARTHGTSSYNFYKLLRYNFDLVTGFSLVPLQIFTLIGMLVSILSVFFVGYLLTRRVVIGPEADGLFSLFAILFLLAGIILMGLGILGEYIGRIYQEVRKRPRYVVRRSCVATSINNMQTVKKPVTASTNKRKSLLEDEVAVYSKEELE